jgi:hypothetical protein
LYNLGFATVTGAIVGAVEAGTLNCTFSAGMNFQFLPGTVEGPVIPATSDQGRSWMRTDSAGGQQTD